MGIYAIGLNHKNAPVEIRERVSFASDIVPDALHDLTRSPKVHEAAILSTCNRTELYVNMDAANSELPMSWLSEFHDIHTHELTPHLYSHPDELAVRHMLRVASGLDSMILGEPQVLGQLKTAYQLALNQGSLGKTLNRLFQHTFKAAKDVRSNTSIGAHPVSVAFAAVRLAKQIFGDLSKQNALLIGAGETIELVARHLQQNSIGKMMIANRTVERSETLAMQYSAQALSLAEIPDHLPQADIVISSTASQLPILGKGALESALRARKHRPMFLVDLAVPRDIEAEVNELDDIYLYTVDDLKDVVKENLNNRKQAAIQAEQIIEVQVHEFMQWMNSLDAVTTIRAVREHTLNLKEQALLDAQIRIRNGADPDRVLTEFAHNLTNKFIHTPSQQLREAGAKGRKELLSAVHELFDLKEPTENVGVNELHKNSNHRRNTPDKN